MRSIQALSWVGMVKLYIGAPMTMASAARNSFRVDSPNSASCFCAASRSSDGVPPATRLRADRWLMASLARSR
ncbi:hypothetical protein D3C77_696290 [compost metagenome]